MVPLLASVTEPPAAVVSLGLLGRAVLVGQALPFGEVLVQFVVRQERSRHREVFVDVDQRIPHPVVGVGPGDAVDLRLQLVWEPTTHPRYFAHERIWVKGLWATS